ncbi:MAG TPA: 3-hydroxyacyl-CoA dehydrogenase [Alphaproteobacteria bacterium]|nr:3-hydroxyacyl-CoA dehydrogenase [Alphaproteobacteria bacterium]
MAALAKEAMVAVVGAGTMGGGIAQVAAAAGHPVLLFDAIEGAAERARTAIGNALKRLVERGRMTAEAREALLQRIKVSTDLAQLAPARLVIEAILEELEAKRLLFKKLEDILAEDAILASNTSSLSITALAAGLRRPGRVCGMHFFNPPPLMPLVEVVSGLASDPAVAEAVAATARAWGKEPVHATSTPGFIVNRVARPFYGEALRLLEEGSADFATIDALVRETGGFRMGPFEVMDLVGQDVNWAVTNAVFAAFFYDPRYKPSLRQKEMVAAGLLGRKSGRGWYSYEAGASAPKPATLPPALPPRRVAIEGRLGPAESLAAAIKAKGIALGPRDDTDAREGAIVLDGAVLRLSDGRSATECAAREHRGEPLVLFDLARDYGSAKRIALAKADQAPPAALAAAAGLFQALGMQATALDDTPGMVVMRIVAMLANEAAEAVSQGVATAQAIDTAMLKGVSYPLGPLAWAEAIGLERVLAVIDNLARSYGEDRYRAAALLRRKVLGGQHFHE